VPCQEEGNIPYVVDNGCGMFERDPAAIAEIIDLWFSPEGEELLQVRLVWQRARAGALFSAIRCTCVTSKAAQRLCEQCVLPSCAPRRL
jgi:hypothetical protein